VAARPVRARSSLAGSRSGRSTSTNTSDHDHATAAHSHRRSLQSHLGHRLCRPAAPRGPGEEDALQLPQSGPQRSDRTACRHPRGGRYLKYRPTRSVSVQGPPLGRRRPLRAGLDAELGLCWARRAADTASTHTELCRDGGHAGESRIRLTAASFTLSPCLLFLPESSPRAATGSEAMTKTIQSSSSSKPCGSPPWPPGSGC
jgi:hypothetical protein